MASNMQYNQPQGRMSMGYAWGSGFSHGTPMIAQAPGVDFDAFVGKDQTAQKDFIMAQRVLNVFPVGFLLFCVAMFVMPIYLVLNVGEDPTARQWFPHLTRIVIVLPVLYFITLLVHQFKGRPSRVLVTLSLIGSCLVLLIISNILLMEAYEMTPMFAAESDCMSWQPKREMQGSWELARTYYATCAQDLAKKNNITFAAAVSQYRIQDCPKYNEDVTLHPDWAYLDYLEATQWCSGWCTAGQSIWTKQRVQDACSPVVAQVIHDKMVWPLKQVCFYSVFTIAVASVVIVSIPRVLAEYGIDW